MDSATRLQKILVDSPVGAVLPAIALLNLPNWWLAGGAVRNTVWRSLFGNDCQLVINDFDIAFFDALGDRLVFENYFSLNKKPPRRVESKTIKVEELVFSVR